MCRAGVLGTMCCFVFMQHNHLITRASCSRYVLCPVDLYEYECWGIVLVGKRVGAIHSASKGANATNFSSLQIISSQILMLIPHSQIRKLLRYQIANPKFALIHPQISNPKISYVCQRGQRG